MPIDTEKSARYKTDAPAIPGVPAGGATSGATPRAETKARSETIDRAIGPAIAILILVAIGVWIYRRAPQRSAESPPPPAATTTDPLANSSAAALPGIFTPDNPVVVGTLAQLAEPWSSKRFTFHKRFSTERVAAMIVRLPGPADAESSYWAFSLEEPYGKCELEFVTDLAVLSSQYGYEAKHPMVTDPCNHTVYDPLKLGNLASGAWARGEVVQGNGIRPPIAIELKLEGSSIRAMQIE